MMSQIDIEDQRDDLSSDEEYESTLNSLKQKVTEKEVEKITCPNCG